MKKLAVNFALQVFPWLSDRKLLNLQTGSNRDILHFDVWWWFKPTTATSLWCPCVLPKAWRFYQGGQLVLQGHCSTAMKRRGWERNSFCIIHIYTVPHVPVLLCPIAVESNTDSGFFLPLLPSVAVGNLLHLMEDWFAIRDWNSCCAWRNFRKGRFTFYCRMSFAFQLMCWKSWPRSRSAWLQPSQHVPNTCKFKHWWSNRMERVLKWRSFYCTFNTFIITEFTCKPSHILWMLWFHGSSSGLCLFAAGDFRSKAQARWFGASQCCTP